MGERWERRFITLDGAELCYRRTGDGTKRALLLVHGFSDNGLCWTPVARALEGDYDIVMPDMRGHGLSRRVELGEHVDMALDLARLIGALGLVDPVVAGHSMGGLVAYQLAVRFPDLVSALILEDPAWFLRSPDAPIFADASPDNPMAQWARSLADFSREELLAGYRRDHPDWDEDLVGALAESKKQLDQRAFEVLFPRMGGDAWPWWDTIQDLAVPLLLLAGDPQRGGIVNAAIIETVRALKPDATIVTVPEAGHLIRFEAFRPFMAALRAFLGSVVAPSNR